MRLMMAASILLIAGFGIAQSTPQPITKPLAEVDLESRLTDAAWNYDGTLLAAATVNSVIVYDLQLTELIRFEAHTEDIRVLNWHPSQHRLLIVGDKAIEVWDLDLTNQTVSFETTLTVENADYPVVAKWSPDGSRLAEIWVDRNLTFADYPGFILFRNATTWDLELQKQDIWPIYNPFPFLFWADDSTRFMYVGNLDFGTSYFAIGDVNTERGVYSHDIGSAEVSIIWKNDTVVYEDGIDLILRHTNLDDPFYILGSIGRTYELDLNPTADKIIRVEFNYVEIIDVATLMVLATYQPTASPDVVHWNPMIDVFVAAGNTFASRDEPLGNITIWDVSSLPSTEGTPTVTHFQSPTPWGG